MAHSLNTLNEVKVNKKIKFLFYILDKMIRRSIKLYHATGFLNKTIFLNKEKADPDPKKNFEKPIHYLVVLSLVFNVTGGKILL